jgi:hypothetical protein
MIHQLRIYAIFEPNKAVFHQRFRDRRTDQADYGFGGKVGVQCLTVASPRVLQKSLYLSRL